MKQWEYKFVSQKTPVGGNKWERESRRFLEGTEVSDLLAELGEQGWELCAIDYSCFILKREKEPT